MHTETLIIGSGIGGLLCGVILAKEGHHVVILEKEPEPGGFLKGFDFNGAHFDTGIHYTGAMEAGMPLHALFQYLGILDKLELRKLDEDGFDRIFINGEEYPLSSGFDNFLHRLIHHFPDESEQLRSFIANIREIASHFPLYNLRIPADTDQEARYHGMSALSFLQSANLSPLLQDVLAGNNFLYGGLTETTPLSHYALINHSFISGAYRFVNGSDQLVKLLIKEIESHGGKIVCGAEVTGIRKQKDGFLTSVGSSELSQGNRVQEAYSSGIVISAIHPATTVRISEPGMFRDVAHQRIGKLANTISVFSLYARLKTGCFPYLNHNSYGLRDRNSIPTNHASGLWPESYLLITPARSDESKWASSLEILSMMRWEDASKYEERTSDAYKRFHTNCTEKLLDMAQQQFPYLRSSILDYTVATPLTWRRYTGSPEGSMYGVLKDCRDPVTTSISSRTRIPGFYFTGQSVNLHGLTGTTVGALMTCGEIIGYDTVLNRLRNG